MTVPIKKQNVVRMTRCNFCAKENQEVKVLISSPGGFGPFPVLICDECVEVCNSIIAEWDAKYKPAETLEQDGRPPVAASEQQL